MKPTWYKFKIHKTKPTNENKMFLSNLNLLTQTLKQ